jgi:hypothetical protein
MTDTGTDARDMRLIDHDIWTHEIDATGYSAIHVFYGEDERGGEWCWMQQVIYDAAADEWIESEPFNMECVG